MLGGLYYTWKDNQKPFEPLTSFRVALGARRADIMRLILAEGGRLILAGTSIGLLAALALSRLLKSLLYTISPHDPLSFAAVTITLTTVALLATLLPARRAASVEPSAALRTE
jgi:ABC-type antimicrobial peptide transport system permease subunit